MQTRLNIRLAKSLCSSKNRHPETGLDPANHPENRSSRQRSRPFATSQHLAAPQKPLSGGHGSRSRLAVETAHNTPKSRPESHHHNHSTPVMKSARAGMSIQISVPHYSYTHGPSSGSLPEHRQGAADEHQRHSTRDAILEMTHRIQSLRKRRDMNLVLVIHTQRGKRPALVFIELREVSPG